LTFEQEERDSAPAPEEPVSAGAEQTEPSEGEASATEQIAEASRRAAEETPTADEEPTPSAEEAAAPGAAEQVAPSAEETEPDTAAPEAADQEAEEASEDAAPVRITQLAADARYFATGKRKTSVARVILRPGNGSFELNGRALDVYFPRRTLQAVVRQPLAATGLLDRIDVRARIHGGGISSQADAVRHGIAKALIEAEPSLRGELKRRQLLTRDPRVKERRKAGLKKARKRPQFSKR
jgi:small subunit ribosomal protein S9